MHAPFAVTPLPSALGMYLKGVAQSQKPVRTMIEADTPSEGSKP